MGKNKELKKLRKYARKEVAKEFKEFQDGFNTSDFLRSCPKFVPKFVWNILIWIIIKKQ